jgi:L-threonylcarbamoyladenylate synthase
MRSSGPACEVIRIAADQTVTPAARRAAEVMRAGGVVLYPADTIYGLGCLAGDREAVRRVYAIKGRPETKPALVLVDSAAMAASMAAEITPLARKLMDACWPGPLTLVLRAAAGVAEGLTAGTGKLGVRFPADEFCVAMVRFAGAAIVSTSANRTGEEPADRFDPLLAQFGTEVELAIDGGPRRGRPSTIVDVSGGSLEILREGAYSAADLRRAAPGIS